MHNRVSHGFGKKSKSKCTARLRGLVQKNKILYPPIRPFRMVLPDAAPKCNLSAQTEEIESCMKIPAFYQCERYIRACFHKGEKDVSSPQYRKKIEPILHAQEGYGTIGAGNTDLAQAATFPSSPCVSIIIPAHNQFRYTCRCLNSVLAHTSHIPCEIILVDDHSTDETQTIETHYPTLRVIRNETTRGFLRNINTAATVSRGTYLCLLNNDTIVTPDWLSSLLRVFEQFERTGLVGSKLVYPTGVMQEAGGYITRDEEIGNFGRGQNYFDPKFNYIRDVDYVSGASLLIRRDLWNDLGGFDEAYLPAYFEDTDLAMRVRQKGFHVRYQPRSVVFHFESISYQQARSEKMELMAKNKSVFLSRWRNEIQTTHASRGDGFRFYERCDDHRPTILYVDTHVPHPYSCGAKLSHAYCKLLRQMGFSVKFLPLYGTPTIENDLVELGQLGIEVLLAYDKRGHIIFYNDPVTKWFRPWFAANRRNITFFLLCRPDSFPIFQAMRQVDPRISFFYHPADLHFLRYERAETFETISWAKKRKRGKQKRREIQLLAQARNVLHVSAFEQTYLHDQYGLTNGAVIPCLIFDEIKVYRKLPASFTELMYIGGGHHASIDGIRWFIDTIFPFVQEACPDVCLHVIGDCGTAVTPKRGVVVHGRLSENDVADFYQKTVAVLPLRFGAGLKGKLLEAMNYGTPFVTTSVGLEGIPGNELTVAAYDTPAAFARRVIEILHDPATAAEDVHRCQQFINTHFTAAVAKSVLKNVFAGLV